MGQSLSKPVTSKSRLTVRDVTTSRAGSNPASLRFLYVIKSLPRQLESMYWTSDMSKTTFEALSEGSIAL
jgi:hypothetical protein